MNAPNTQPFDSYTKFVEQIVLPRLLLQPNNQRLDGQSGEGNWDVAGLFKHDNAVWRAHEDCHFEPLLLAYYHEKYHGEADTFQRTATEKSIRLELVSELASFRRSRHRHMYIYLAE